MILIVIVTHSIVFMAFVCGSDKAPVELSERKRFAMWIMTSSLHVRISR